MRCAHPLDTQFAVRKIPHFLRCENALALARRKVAVSRLCDAAADKRDGEGVPLNARAVHLVRVTTSGGEEQLWAAAVSRDEAVGHVLKAAPHGCNARLMDDRLKPRKEAVSTMAPGEVRELVK